MIHSKTTDRAIRRPLLKWLRSDFDSPYKLVQELGVCEGQVRIDVAVINGDLHGFEIKSDADTLTRLPRQIEIYGKVFDYVTLVVGKAHLVEARRMIPNWWGILVAKKESSKSKVEIAHRRKPRRNRSPQPLAVVQLLWREEARKIAQKHGISVCRTDKRSDLWTRLADELPAPELSQEVRKVLKKRRGWRVAKQPAQGSGSSPTVARNQRSQENLEWLLAHGSLGPPH